MLYIVIHSKVPILLVLNLEVLTIDGVFQVCQCGKPFFFVVSKILVHLIISILDWMDYEIQLYHQEGYGSLDSNNIHCKVKIENLCLMFGMLR